MLWLLLASATTSNASAQSSEDTTSDSEPPAPQWRAEDVTVVRLTLGINGAPLVNHVGFHLGFDYVVLGWDLGEVVVGAQLATHFYLPIATPQPGVAYSTLDASVRLHGTVGHVFTLASRELRIGTHLFVGPSLRTTTSSLQDPAHGIDLTYDHLEPLFEVGAALVIGWRMLEHLGVNVSIAIPLWVSGSNQIMAAWLAAPPFLGGSITAYL